MEPTSAAVQKGQVSQCGGAVGKVPSCVLSNAVGKQSQDVSALLTCLLKPKCCRLALERQKQLRAKEMGRDMGMKEKNSRYYSNILSSTQKGKELTHRANSFPSPEVTCPRPPNIANGLHSGQSLDRFPRGMRVHYSCQDGYAPVGNVSISCTEAGMWSWPLPRCEGGWRMHCEVWGWRKGCWMFCL